MKSIQPSSPQCGALSGERSRGTSLGMAAPEGERKAGLGGRRCKRSTQPPARERWIEFRPELPRAHSSGPGGEARTFSLNSSEPGAGSGLDRHAHRAVVLAVATAAGRQTGFGIGRKHGRYQHGAEDQHQQNCDSAAHECDEYTTVSNHVYVIKPMSPTRPGSRSRTPSV
jgi:hypothetical protein